MDMGQREELSPAESSSDIRILKVPPGAAWAICSPRRRYTLRTESCLAFVDIHGRNRN